MLIYMGKDKTHIVIQHDDKSYTTIEFHEVLELPEPAELRIEDRNELGVDDDGELIRLMEMPLDEFMGLVTGVTDDTITMRHPSWMTKAD